MVVNGKTQIASMKMVMIKRIWRRAFREETMVAIPPPSPQEARTNDSRKAK